MKKILLLGMLLAGAIVFAGKYEDEMTERMKVVEEKFQPDLESGSTDGMLNASYKLTAEWEKELNNVYNLILKKLPAKEKSKFKAEQEKWIKSRKAATKEALANEEDGPRMALFGAAGTEYEMTKARVLELAKRYDKLNK